MSLIVPGVPRLDVSPPAGRPPPRWAGPTWRPSISSRPILAGWAAQLPDWPARRTLRQEGTQHPAAYPAAYRTGGPLPLEIVLAVLLVLLGIGGIVLWVRIAACSPPTIQV